MGRQVRCLVMRPLQKQVRLADRQGLRLQPPSPPLPDAPPLVAQSIMVADVPSPPSAAMNKINSCMHLLLISERPLPPRQRPCPRRAQRAPLITIDLGSPLAVSASGAAMLVACPVLMVAQHTAAGLLLRD